MTKIIFFKQKSYYLERFGEKRGFYKQSQGISQCAEAGYKRGSPKHFSAPDSRKLYF